MPEKINLSTYEVDNSLNNINFAAYCVQMIGQPYWYGGCGHKASESLLTRKTKQYPEHYKSDRTARYRQDIANKCVVADCVGAAKSVAWVGCRNILDVIGTDKSLASNYASNGCPDKSANGMFEYAKKKGMEWGTIDTIPEILGLAVRYDGHVGYYAGNGEVIEWRGFAHGCVRTKLASRKWTHWYKLPFINYGDAERAEPTEVVLGSRLLKKGATGSDVKALQELLLQLGYTLPKYGADADFGSETEAAVKSFQKKAGLKQDGQYGELTHAALMAAVSDDDAAKKDESSVPDTEKPDELTPIGTKVTIVAENGHVNIRKGNGTQYGVITTVASGTTFEYVATAVNGWHAVVTGGQVGWVSGNYSRIV